MNVQVSYLRSFYGSLLPEEFRKLHLGDVSVKFCK